MEIALVLTVKNESRILRNNLLYHQAIGVSKAFVYFDGATDDGKDTLNGLDFVSIQDSVNSDTYKSYEFLDKFTTQAEEHHTARQCLNTYDALHKCKALGIDWLISIDADELIATTTNKPSNLNTFFKNLDNTIDLVNFRTLEVLQQKSNYNNVFAEASLFKTQKIFKSWGENILRKIYNPSLKKHEKHFYWYGQTMGKSAIKVSASILPKNVHRYTYQDGMTPKSINAGFVLHYHAYDGEDFIKKFRNFSQHPDYFLSGNRIEALKLVLKDVVNNHGYSDEDLMAYFNKNLLFKPKEINKLLSNKKFKIFKRKKAALKKVTSVVRVFEKIHMAQRS